MRKTISCTIATAHGNIVHGRAVLYACCIHSSEERAQSQRTGKHPSPEWMCFTAFKKYLRKNGKTTAFAQLPDIYTYDREPNNGQL